MKARDNPKEQTERSLIASCVKGDAAAWQVFVKRFAPVVYAAAHGILKRAQGEAEVEDVVQDVFTGLVEGDFRRLRSFDPDKASFATWLRVVALRRSTDVLRRQKASTLPLSEREVAPSSVPPTEPAPIPSNLLSPRQRLVLHMLFDRNLDTASTAQLLGIRVQSVRSAKHKALTKLRDFFGARIENVG